MWLETYTVGTDCPPLAPFQPRFNCRKFDITPTERRRLIILQHIDSTDPFKAPLIDPKYLSNAFGLFFPRVLPQISSRVPDVETLLAGYRLMEKVVGTDPLKDLIEAQQLPPAVLSEDEHALG